MHADGCVDIGRLVGFVQQIRHTARENGDDITAQLPASELLASFSSRFNAAGGVGGGRSNEVRSVAPGAVQGLGVVGDYNGTDALAHQEATGGQGDESNLFGVNGSGDGGGGGGGDGRGDGVGAGASGSVGLGSQGLLLADNFLNARNSRGSGGGERSVIVKSSGGNDGCGGGSGSGSGNSNGLDVVGASSASQAPDLLHTERGKGGNSEAPGGASLSGGGGGGHGGTAAACSWRAGLRSLVDAAQLATESEEDGSGGASTFVGGKAAGSGVGGGGGGGGGGGDGVGGDSGGVAGGRGSGPSDGDGGVSDDDGGRSGGGSGGRGGGGGGSGGSGGSSSATATGKRKLFIPAEGFADDGNDISKIANEASVQ